MVSLRGMEYKASKAWHFAHQLALAIREIIDEVDASDEIAVTMASRLKRNSTKAPNALVRSIEKELKVERMKCYRMAKVALEDVRWHLRLALRLKYIDEQLFQNLEKLAVTAHHELNDLIESERVEPSRE